MGKEPAAAERRDTLWWKLSIPVLPRHWPTTAVSVRHRHPKVPPVVTRLQMVGVGFRCLHHHCRFPVKLERELARDTLTCLSHCPLSWWLIFRF